MVDCLALSVSQIKKKHKGFPVSESSLVARVFSAINKRKAHDVFVALEKANRIKKHIGYYVENQFCSVAELEQKLASEKDKLVLFEMLLIVHLISASAGKDRLFDFKKYFNRATTNSPVFPEPEVSDVDFYLNTIKNIECSKSIMTLEEFAETLILPAGTYAGKHYRHYRAPYNRQIHRWMSPESDVHTLVNMWSVQVGKSTALENACIYYMKIVPAEIMAVLASGHAAEEFSKKRIEGRAARAGVKFVAENFGDSKKRSSGNKILSKQFYGGNFDAVTAGSPSQTASSTKRISLQDELDRWAEKTSEGDPEKAVDKRCDAWGNRAKKMKVSSPLIKDTSRIYRAYAKGSQHHFHIECPLCGSQYPLEMGTNQSHGLKYETHAGKISYDTVFYICPTCQDPWQEKSKLGAMQNGEWVAHATAYRDGYVSTQLNAIYSPFRDWVDICLEDKDVQETGEGEQEFQNMTMGLPYEIKGTRPEINDVYNLRDHEQLSGEVPEGVLYLTAAVDVQRGGQTAQSRKKNPPRLEVEILGHCDGYVTKSIEYIQIMGDTDVADRGAWKKLRTLMAEKHFSYERKRDKLAFAPMIWLIDARDGERTDIVYQFCALVGGAQRRVFPSMGTDYIKRETNSKGSEDKRKTRDYHRYKYSKVDENITMYMISTNHYKRNIYRNLDRSIERRAEIDEFAGRMYFPMDYPDSYFDGLTVEELKPDGTFFCPSGARNEALDIKVYNLAGGEIWLNIYIDSLKKQMKAAKVKDLSGINYRFALDRLAKLTKQKWTLKEKK